MTGRPEHRWLWLWFGIPAGLFCLTALLALTRPGGGISAAFSPVQLGPFVLTGWQLPAQYQFMVANQYIGGAGFAVTVGQLGQSESEDTLNTVLRLEPDGHDGLSSVEQHDTSGLCIPEQLTSDGRVLVQANADDPAYVHDVVPGLPVTADDFRDLLPLAGGPYHGPPLRFDLGYDDDRRVTYNLLEPQRLALVERPPSPGGPARLRIAEPGVKATVRQEVDDAAVCGEAWDGVGPSIGVLTRSGKLFVLDRKLQRLVERPELSGLGRMALKHTPHIDNFALSGQVLITLSTGNDKLRLFTLNGEREEITLDDVLGVDPTYGFYVEGPTDPRGVGITDHAGLRKRLSELRLAGEQASLRVASNCAANELFTFDENQFIYADQAYVRLTLIRYIPTTPPQSASALAAPAQP